MPVDVDAVLFSQTALRDAIGKTLPAAAARAVAYRCGSPRRISKNTTVTATAISAEKITAIRIIPRIVAPSTFVTSKRGANEVP